MMSEAKDAAKVPCNLSVDGDLATAVKTFVTGNKRKGRRNVSELTENLWIGYLRRQGVKLPESVILKMNGSGPRRSAPKLQEAAA